MKFIRFLTFLACFASVTNTSFAGDEIIELVLYGGGLATGKPEKFYMNKTQKYFCADDKCTSQITQLTQLPEDKMPYVGSVVKGFPIIDRNGKFMASSDLFKRELYAGTSYNVKALFYSGRGIHLDLDKEGFNVYPTGVFLESPSYGWLDEKTKAPVTQLSTLPSVSGKVFLGYSVGPDINEYLVIDRYGNILPQAESLSGVMSLYTRWAKAITCDKKSYLPAYSNYCKECLANNWCPGGIFEEKPDTDQGMNACPFGKVSEPASYLSEQCKDPDPSIAVVCQPGNFLPAYSKPGQGCIPCKEKNWCPGGIFYYKTSETGVDSGMNPCPNGGMSNIGADSINKCYMPGLAVSIDHGKGTYSCYWYSVGYTANCFDYKIDCESGYHINYLTSPISCALDGTACGNDPSVLEYNSKCIPIKCKTGYHIENNACVSNSATCDIENGTGRKEWMGDNMLGGKWTMCTAFKCNPGYTSERYLTDEKSKPCGECRNKRNKNGDIVVSSWKDTNCEIATCMNQGELYRLSKDNECVQICDTIERKDETGTMVWNPQTEKCERSCNPGFMSW